MTNRVTIERFAVKRFGCLPEDMEIVYQPKGVNLITGPNESGKSTTMSAILATIFCDFDVKRFFPWGASDDIEFAATVELGLSNSRTLRITRNFDSYHTEVFLFSEGDRKELLLNDKISPQGKKGKNEEFRNILRKYIGFSGSGFFYLIHFIRQEEMETSLEQTFLQDISVGEKENLGAVIENLKTRHKEITRDSEFFKRSGGKDREIENIQYAISEFETRKAQVLSDREQSSELRDSMSALEEELQQKEKEIVEHETRLSLEEDLFDLVEKKDRLGKSLNELRKDRERVERLEQQIRSCEERINKDFFVFKKAPDSLNDSFDDVAREQAGISAGQETLERARKDADAHQEQIETLEHEIETLNQKTPINRNELGRIEDLLEKVNALQSKEDDKKQAIQKHKSRKVQLIVGAILLLVGLGVLLLSFLTSHLLLFAGIPLTLAGGFLSITSLNDMSAIKTRLAIIEEQEREINKVKEELRKEFSGDALRLFEDISAGTTGIEHIREQLHKIEELSNKVNLYRNEQTRIQERLQNLQDELQKKIDHLDEIKSSLKEFLIDGDLDVTRKKFREYQDLKSSYETLLKSRKEDTPIDKIVDEEDKARLEYDRIARSLDEFLKENPPMEFLKDRMETDAVKATQSLSEKKQTLKRLKDERDEIKERLNTMKIQQEALKTSREEFSADRLKELIREKKEELETIKRRADAISIAVHTLEDAVDQFDRKYSTVIIKTASDTFGAVTRNNYQGIERQDSKIRLLTKGGTFVEPESLSQGAQDQLYLSVRLALARALSSHVSLPLILDDPFVHCDNARLAEIKKLIQYLAADWQVILFTCHHERFNDWGDCVYRFKSNV